MRIVLDTSSKGWRTFKRVSLGILYMSLFFMAIGIAEKYTVWDLDFVSGYIAAIFILKYKWIE